MFIISNNTRISLSLRPSYSYIIEESAITTLTAILHKSTQLKPLRSCSPIKKPTIAIIDQQFKYSIWLPANFIPNFGVTNDELLVFVGRIMIRMEPATVRICSWLADRLILQLGCGILTGLVLLRCFSCGEV